ncbi:MAG: non-heme iron oxygenase ferredoxin subunit [Acidobacteriia bacterium]|nr:non-heme iron oxygenase ferredoxin subunit [Terriglobia bacterium]
MSKRPSFIRVASVDDIPEGTVRHLVVHEKPMALCRVEGSFYAINAVCPHMGGPLTSGRLEGPVIACPWHGWTFDVRTGQPDHPGGHSISTYEVRVEGDDILVGWLRRPSS